MASTIWQVLLWADCKTFDLVARLETAVRRSLEAYWVAVSKQEDTAVISALHLKYTCDIVALR
jgi:hypothetical protein